MRRSDRGEAKSADEGHRHHDTATGESFHLPLPPLTNAAGEPLVLVNDVTG
jgi:hypothetical protein